VENKRESQSNIIDFSIEILVFICKVQKLEIFKFICGTAGPHDLIQSEIRRALGVFVWTITCVW
jgi:hypothetical protein